MLCRLHLLAIEWTLACTPSPQRPFHSIRDGFQFLSKATGWKPVGERPGRPGLGMRDERQIANLTASACPESLIRVGATMESLSEAPRPGAVPSGHRASPRFKSIEAIRAAAKPSVQQPPGFRFGAEQGKTSDLGVPRQPPSRRHHPSPDQHPLSIQLDFSPASLLSDTTSGISDKQQ